MGLSDDSVSTQLGHSPAHQAILESDIQRRPSSSALPPQPPFSRVALVLQSGRPDRWLPEVQWVALLIRREY